MMWPEAFIAPASMSWYLRIHTVCGSVTVAAYNSGEGKKYRPSGT